MAGDSTPADTMRERAGTNRLKLWFFVDAGRLSVAVLVLVAVFLSLVAVAAAVPGAAASLASGDPVETAFQAFVGATITGVTLVLTLNQLVLSQELGAVGDQRDRMEGAMQFRRDVEGLLESPISPPEPAAFLRALVDRVSDRAGALEASVEASDGELQRTVATLCSDIEENAASVTDQLASAQFGTFDVVSAALNFNYSWKIYSARRLRAEYGDRLSEEQRDHLDSLVETLELFGPAREHFKTLYVQWELVDLSRTMLAASLPAIATATLVLLYFDAAALSARVFGVPASVLVVSAGVTVSLSPFAVLLSYVLRIATVTKRTLSIGSFTLRRTTDRDGIDWARDDE
jgi:hypothetical protein